MISYSVLIPVYNEEETIGGLMEDVLPSESPGGFQRDDIVVVASGCSDDTVDVIEDYEGRVTFLREEERRGKASAIRKGIKNIESDVVVLSSGDLRWEEESLSRLLAPLKDDSVGVVTSRPSPSKERDDFTGFYNRFLWDLHHYLSRQEAKAGETIAFRNEVEDIPESCVADEEYIVSRLEESYEKIYAPDAVVRNRTPASLGDIYLQRRRVFRGHIDLYFGEHYLTPSTDLSLLFKSLREYIANEGFDIRMVPAVFIEAVARADAFMRYLAGGEKPYIWKQVEQG
ncbi:MAG: glycosyltransferase [Candidatus Nanohaloarchaea archaeon]